MAVIIDGTSGVTTPGVTSSGTDEAAVQTQGGVAMPRMVLSTAQNTTSGTSIDFTSIPSWVKRITVMFNGVSTNGTSIVQIQLGTGSTTYTTSGYLGTGSVCGNAGTPLIVNNTAGFLTSGNTAATYVRHGSFVLNNITGNTWVINGNTSNSESATVEVASGSIGLAAALTAVRLTTVNGTDTFDAGSVNILYEG